MRTGWFRQVHVKSRQSRLWRALLVARRTVLKVSRCGDELARTALYAAAHCLLGRSRTWSSLRAWGMQIAKHRGLARARVAVARKLAVILHRMWRDETVFRVGQEPTAVAPAA